MSETAVYAGLFLTAFLAATVLPAQSEVVLTALLLGGDYQTWLLIVTASAGNILGAVVNWTLGRGIERFQSQKWFPFQDDARIRAQRWYQRYGRWSLLLSWVPVVGDALTLAAGVMRERLSVFLLFVTVAKAGRYLILWAIIRFSL